MTLPLRLALRVFASSDPMRRDDRRIHPQSADARRHIAHIRAKQAERART